MVKNNAFNMLTVLASICFLYNLYSTAPMRNIKADPPKRHLMKKPRVRYHCYLTRGAWAGLTVTLIESSATAV